MLLHSLVLLSSVSLVLAGIGGSAVSLSVCNASSPRYAGYQQWNSTSSGSQLRVIGDANPLWGSTWCLSTGTGINSVAVGPNATIFTSGCGSALKLSFTPDVPSTSLALTGAGAGLCIAVQPPGALPGVGLWLVSCDVSDALQKFSFSPAAGTLTHAPSGLCVDSGSRETEGVFEKF